MTIARLVDLIEYCMPLMSWILWAFMLAFICSVPCLIRQFVKGVY